MANVEYGNICRYGTLLGSTSVGASSRRQRFLRVAQDLSFGGYHRDDLGKDIVWDDSRNGLELGPANEVTKGWKAADRFAAYTTGSGTDTLTFVYKIQEVSERLATSGVWIPIDRWLGIAFRNE